MKVQHFALEFLLPVSRELAWELLANTDRMNERLRLPQVVFGAPLNATDLGCSAAARYLGLPLTWTEQPFEWVHHERYSVARTYERGIMREFCGGVELHDAELFNGTRGTRAQLWAEVTPRHAVSAPLVAWLARQGLRKTRRSCQDACALETGASERRTTLSACDSERDAMGATHAVTRHASRVNDDALRARLRVLAESHSPELVSRLGAYLRACSDNEVMQLRPYELAARWELDRDLVLRACLQSARDGLLVLQWRQLCPFCRVSHASHPSLSGVTANSHCDWCGVDYAADFGSSVELRFAIHPAIRAATSRVYGLYNPARSPHIHAQARLGPGQSVRWTHPLGATRNWRVRVSRANHVLSLDANANDFRFVYGGDGWQVEPVSDGTVDVVLLRNATTREIVVVLERVARDDFAVTAQRVAAMREFRDYFGHEVLRPGVAVGVAEVALLFSELQASTAFYERVGEVSAHNWVQRHFEIIGQCAAQHSGGIVKTMGDAAMVTFVTPQHALEAALSMRAALRPLWDEVAAELQRDNADNALPLVLPAIKIGVACGSALVVNADNRLDYFGRTVNAAARLGRSSDGSDIVLSEQCLDVAARASLLARGFDARAERDFNGDAIWRVQPATPSTKVFDAPLALETMLDNLVEELSRGVPTANVSPTASVPELLRA